MFYLKAFFFSASLLFVLLLGFVHAIDPYEKYGINLFGLKTKSAGLARELKFNMLEQSKKEYQAFIVGSSSVQGLHTAQVEKLTGLKTFNYAVGQTTPEDQLAITRHIFSSATPKLLLLQIDLSALNKKAVSITETSYFSVSALVDSYTVLSANLSGPGNSLYLEDGNLKPEKSGRKRIKLRKINYSGFVFSPERIKALKSIKALCNANKVKVIAWTAPVSRQHYQRIVENPESNRTLGDFKKTLVGIFGEVHDFTNEDVSRYNDTKYFQDSTHPTKYLFKVMVEEMLGGEATFGRKLK
ncbi:MAG TPA: hypothetical protein VNJ01_10225 [Bacteriovoracaceae bacterium]|nr:hypothetical protein [Bacteriovoracaceae bacterium]